MTNETHIRFDWAIKVLLKNKANFGILEGFLSELLGEDIKIQDIIESEGNRESANAKTNRVDIMIRNSKGELIIVEIQNTRELDYFYKILYNTSKAVTEHIDRGMKYSSVKKVITVSVVYFDLGQGRDYIYHGNTKFIGLHNHEVLELSEPQKRMFKVQTVEAIYPDHYIIRVNEFDDISKDSLDEWIYFFKNSVIKDEFKAKGLAEAREKLKEINLTGRELAAYKRYLEELMFEASVAETIKFEEQYGKELAREEGWKEGREEGREEGERKKTVEMAKKSLEEGLSPELIARITGLSLEEIDDL